MQADPGNELRQLCERIAAVLRGGEPGGASPLMAGIERALTAGLRECLRGVTAELRRELEAALGAVADLERLAQSVERPPVEIRDPEPAETPFSDGACT
jgi:hypothetical protein